MTSQMRELFNAYGVALVNETHVCNDERASERRCAEASERLKVRRANLVKAIEDLEREAGR